MNVSPVWTNKLTIVNAGSVGDSSFTSGSSTVTRSFNAYLFNISGGTSQVNITSNGKVYLKLTAAELMLLNAAQWADKPWTTAGAFTGAGVDMRLQNITAASGVVNVDLPQGVRAYQLAGTNTLTMPVPGTLEYVTDALHTLTQNVTLTGMDALQFYLTGYNSSQDVYSFLLPNGTLLYTDALGNVLRITENDVDFAVGDFAFTRSEAGVVTSIKLAAGVSIDLANGWLTVDAGASYEVLLSAISGSWLLNNIRLSSGSIDLVLSTTNYSTDKDGLPVYTSLESVVSLSSWWTNGTLSCYYVTGQMPQAGSETLYYILTYDSATDTLQPYMLEKEEPITSSVNSDSVRAGNLKTDDGEPYTVKMKSGNIYYELVSGAYQGSVSDAAVLRASSVYTFGGLASVNIQYDRNTGGWSYGGTQLDVSYANGLYFVPDNYTTSNTTLAPVYASLKGKYWSVDSAVNRETRTDSGAWTANMPDDKFGFAAYAYTSDKTNYYWVTSTNLYDYTLGLKVSSAVPLSLMIAENENKTIAGTSGPKKDYVLTFGTPGDERSNQDELPDVCGNPAWMETYHSGSGGARLCARRAEHSGQRQKHPC